MKLLVLTFMALFWGLCASHQPSFHSYGDFASPQLPFEGSMSSVTRGSSEAEQSKE